MFRKQILLLFSLLFCSFISLFFLWAQPIILTLILIALSVIKYIHYPLKHELIFYLVIVVGGGLVEILMVNVAHAWSYVFPTIFSIPLFMPFLWGFIGIIIIHFYKEFSSK